jgi:hypothetical protein
MRVAHKDVTITKNTLFTAILAIGIFSPWWPWLQVTKPAAGLRLTNLAILSQAPIFSYSAERLTIKPKKEERLSPGARKSDFVGAIGIGVGHGASPIRNHRMDLPSGGTWKILGQGPTTTKIQGDSSIHIAFVTEKCFPQGRITVWTFDLLVAFGDDPLDDLIDQCRIVRAPDRH